MKYCFDINHINYARKYRLLKIIYDYLKYYKNLVVV